MHLKSLKVFCDVVSQRSFSRAADQNEISQSAVSQVVNQLEQRLGAKLIDRSRRPFVLTAEGQVYYDGCRKLVQHYFALEEDVRTLHQEVAGRVSVASIYSVGLSHMHAVIQQFLTKYPKAKVHVEYQHPGKVYELVEQAAVDLGLISYPKGSRSVKVIPWRDERMVLVCAPDSPFAGRDEVAVNELHGADMVGFNDGLKIRRAIDRAFADHGAEAKVVMEFDNIEIIKRAIEIGAGYALLPAPTVAAEVKAGSLTTVPLVGDVLVRPLGIICRRGRELGKTAKRFIKLLQENADAPFAVVGDMNDERQPVVAEARSAARA